MVEILIPIVFFLATAAVLIVVITARHRERMTMVEKGLSTDEMKAIYAGNIKRDPLTSLKWGILFVFAGVAIFFGGVLHEYFHIEGGIIFGMVAAFIGVGLLIFYAIASKKMKAQ